MSCSRWKSAAKKVLLKPNVLRTAKAEEAITTHPAVLRAVLDHVETMGPAEIVVGDNPGLFNYGANEAGFRECGLLNASRGYYRNIGTESVEVDFNPVFKDRVSVSRAVLDADVFISLPKFKTHGLTVITGALKNSYGILPGAQKAVLHRLAGNPFRFHELIVDVFRLRVPDLFIMDAVIGMEGNGPTSPDLRRIGLLMASDNAVALDAVMARMMGVDPHLLRCLEKAREEGLGDWDAGTLEIVGQFQPLDGFKLPPLGGEAIASSQDVRAVLENRTLLRPKADPDLCTGCGSCVDQCPASALAMSGDIPEVDPEKCIVCFCCQEVCPEKAIQLQ